MQAVILKCPPRAQFHFGKIALDVDTSLYDTSVFIHSDTLFSAIIVTLEQLWGEADKFVGYFEDEIIRISSAFHCLEKTDASGFVYFLPKPAHFNVLDEPADNDERKRQVKVRFISKKTWEMGLRPNDWGQSCSILQDEFVLHLSELPGWDKVKTEALQIYETHSLPKVSVHKPSKEDSIYFQTNVELAANPKLKGAPQCHYYFLLDTSDKLPANDLNKLRAALAVIADSGIGGERSVGCGRLTGVAFENFHLDVEGGGQWCSLSLINPDPAELHKLKYWQIISRGGRRVPVSDVRRPKLLGNNASKLRRVKMLAEGALLTEDLGGRLVDISVPQADSNHLRNGKGFSLPIHQNVHSS